MYAAVHGGPNGGRVHQFPFQTREYPVYWYGIPTPRLRLFSCRIRMRDGRGELDLSDGDHCMRE